MIHIIYNHLRLSSIWSNVYFGCIITTRYPKYIFLPSAIDVYRLQLDIIACHICLGYTRMHVHTYIAFTLLIVKFSLILPNISGLYTSLVYTVYTCMIRHSIMSNMYISACILRFCKYLLTHSTIFNVCTAIMERNNKIIKS